MNYAVPLIGEAWEHRRRRRRRALGAVAMAGAMVAVLALVESERPGVRPWTGNGLQAPSNATLRSPSAVFSQPPYMGVRCPIPNSIACDRVGLAVWLKHPAYSVRATIAGAELPLNWFGDEHLIKTPLQLRREFDGYLRPAGISSRLHVHPDPGNIWGGEGAPSPVVWVLIDYGRGRYVVTHLHVALAAGWG